MYINVYINVYTILSILKKKIFFIGLIGTKLFIPKMCLLECHKTSLSEHPLEINLLRDPKHCSNLQGSNFMLMFH